MLKTLYLILHILSLFSPRISDVPILKEASFESLQASYFDNHKTPQTVHKSITWDQDTLTRVSSTKFRTCDYARLIQLHDKSLLCVYEADGSIMASKSFDLGKTWNKPVSAAWRQDGINMAAPDVLELQDHSILVCYNPRPYKISGSRCFGIRTRKSYDGGKTWIHGRLIHEAGHKFKNGCWEPSVIQLPSGEIQLYFADESLYRHSNEQNISLLRSKNGGLTWTEKPEIVSFRPGGRDGMPSPLLLNNGNEIACAIEDIGWLGSFKPAILRTPVRDTWSLSIGVFSPDRNYALPSAIGFNKYAGAPNLQQLSTGETLLSYQGTEQRPNHLRNAEMKVAVGDNSARNFAGKTVPFQIPKNRFGLWNSLAVLDDDTVVALTSTNAYSPHTEIWLIKGRLLRTSNPDKTK